MAAEKQRLLKLSDELHGLIAGLVVEGPSLPSVSSRRTPGELETTSCRGYLCRKGRA